MKILSKNKMAMCVGALLGTAAIVPSAYAVHFSADGLGDSLSNYYTTHDGNATLINYTNTSDQTIAMRVRIHEYRNSRSWDFTVILSPYDVWNATIADGGSLGPVIFTGDESCTIPAISRDSANPTVIANAGFMAAIDDGGPVTTERLKEGYVNAIVMGSKPGEPGPAANGRTACEVETARFVNYGGTAWRDLLANYPNYTNNAIKGVFNILNIPLGQNAAQGMDTLANFFAVSTTQVPQISAPYATNTSGANNRTPQYPAFATTTNAVGGPPKNLVTLQMHPDNISLLGNLLTPEQRYLASFFLPTKASANTFAYYVFGNNAIATTSPAAINRRGAEAVAFLHQATNVINMWTALQNEAAWDTATDIVVMADVKKFYVDGPAATGTNPMQGRYQWTPGVPPTNSMNNTVPTAPFTEYYGAKDSANAGLSCDPVSWDIWDREENWDPKPVLFSPQKWGPRLCFETNVITFNGLSALSSPNSYNIDSSFPNGWIDLSLISEANRYTNGAQPSVTTLPFAGLPVASWGFTTRVNDAGLNEAVSFPSALKRNPPTVAVRPVP